MNIKFIEYEGIKGYSRVMYNDVKDADKYNIEVAYNGKDIKTLLEYLFEQENKIDKAIEYIKHSQSYGTMAQVMPHLKPYVNGDDLLEILGDKEND